MLEIRVSSGLPVSIFSSGMVHFQVRWGDAHDGYGEHYYEYNHGPSAYEEPKYAPVKAPYVPAPPSYTS